MKTIQIIEKDSGNVIVSITDYGKGKIRGIADDRFVVKADGVNLIEEKENDKDSE